AFSGQRLNVALRPSAQERTETVVGPRYFEVLRLVCRDHQEDHPVWSSLMQLAGGMEIARAVAERGGDFEAVADEGTDRLQRVLVLLRWVEIGQDGEVIAGRDAVDQRGDVFVQIV